MVYRIFEAIGAISGSDILNTPGTPGGLIWNAYELEYGLKDSYLF